MKIIYIIDSLVRIGGMERILVNKMNWFVNNTDYAIHLLTWEQHDIPPVFGLSSKIVCHDIGVETFKIYRHKKFVRPYYKYQMMKTLQDRLQQAINKIQPNIILASTYYMPKMICQLKTTAKIIIESHSAKSQIGQNVNIKNSALKKWFLSFCTMKALGYVEKHADCIVALTNGDAKNWKTNNIKVIPNMLKRHTYGVDNYSAKRVVAIGRLSYEKGYDMLINLWKPIYANYPDWKLDIYGDGNIKDTLQKQIDDLGMHNIITLHGKTSNVNEEYSKSSILAFTSRYEGFGLALAEAMSCGLPAVSFNCPYGPADIITDGEDGFLVQPGDCDEFAKKIIYLIQHQEERERMGQNAKKNIARFYSEHIMPQWKNLFEQLS